MMSFLLPLAPLIQPPLPRHRTRPGSALRRAFAALGLAGACLLAGCAGHASFREAQGLIEDKQPRAALAKLKEAVTQDPANTEYRTTYLLVRQRLLSQELDEAAKLAAKGQRGEAAARWRAALEIDPANSTARNGLAGVARDTRLDDTLVLAAADQKAGREAAARRGVQAVLEESPQHPRARSLLKDIHSASEPTAAEARLADGFRKTVSIDFKDASLRQVLDVLSRSSGLNFLLDRDVKPDLRTSLSLKDATVESALRYVLLALQLEQQVMDDHTVMVFPNTPGKLKDYQPVVMRTFILANASAKAVAEGIRTLVKSRDVLVDDKLNMVILRDSPEAVRLAERIVALYDVAEPEVMLEVEVLEVSRDRLTELGVNWPGSLSLTPLAAATGALTVGDLRRLNRDTLGVSIDPLSLNLRKVDGDTNLLANPRIRVLSREKAKIVIGNRVPSVTTSVIATGIVTESVSYMDVGLKLEVEPIVYVDNDVTIKLSLEVSNIVSSKQTARGSMTYTIGTRAANTTLRLKDGENQVLAGLINDEDRNTANKIPILGDLPLAGRLFGSGLADGRKNEIVLSITPRLVRNQQRPAPAQAEFVSGAGSPLRNRDSADQPAAAQPAPAPRAALGN